MLPELAANKPGMETPDVPLLWVVFPQHCCPSLLRSPCTDLLCPRAQQPPPALPGLGAVLQAGETLQNLS